MASHPLAGPSLRFCKYSVSRLLPSMGLWGVENSALAAQTPLTHPCTSPLRAEARPGKSAAVSSLDCLSSIVERISTESPTAPALLLTDAPPESPPCQPAAAAPTEAEGGAPSPALDAAPQGSAGADPNPIYQVL